MKNRLLVGALLLVGACDMHYLSGIGQPLAQMTFEHVEKYPIYVASYETINLSNNTKLPEGFVINPSDNIYKYFNSRFEASGSQGKLNITIKNVSVIHEVIQSKNKISGFIGIDKSDHYLVQAEIIMKLYGDNEAKNKEITFKSSRNIYISEHLSVVNREKLQMQALDKLIDDIDIAITGAFKNTFLLL